jgi:hypothetical protein
MDGRACVVLPSRVLVCRGGLEFPDLENWGQIVLRFLPSPQLPAMWSGLHHWRLPALVSTINHRFADTRHLTPAANIMSSSQTLPAARGRKTMVQFRCEVSLAA